MQHQIVELARQAGQAIMPYWHSGSALTVQDKADNTPVTQADLAAQQVIAEGLQVITPDIPVISEEQAQVPAEQRLAWPQCWIVDPLDGTRGFIAHCEEFTVNIALADSQHNVILGVIYVPVLDHCYYATKGEGAFRQLGNQAPERLQTRPFSPDTMHVLIGHYHNLDRVPAALQPGDACSLSSVNSSLKFCLLAAGEADLYPRMGPTNEWDTAAGQCILEEAGGKVVDFSGQSLQYNARQTLLNPEFLALGDASQFDRIMALVQS